LPSFYGDANAGAEPKSTTTDVARLIEKLKTMNVQGIVLDLRRNGSLLSEVISWPDYLLIKARRPSEGFTRTHKSIIDDDESVLYADPLVVLVHHTSASAAEFFLLQCRTMVAR